MPKKLVRVSPKKPESKIDRRLIPGSQFGEGGMSILLDAFDTNLMRTVAMKVLHEDMEKDEQALGKMIMEAQITAQLNHPNIVPVYELGMDRKKRLFFTMKRVNGRPLFEVIREQNFSSRTERELFQMVQIMIKVCNGVSYAHSKGVLHRDLKPDNIMVGNFGQVYVMDWGVARVGSDEKSSADDPQMPELKKRKEYHIKTEHMGAVVGTPCYMSPEQAQGDLEAMDERSDVFSLGAIIYEILTGSPPIQGDSLYQMVMSARKCEIQFPYERVNFPLPRGLVKIAMKAMSKAPEDRHQSVAELKNDLENFLAGGWHFPVKKFKPGDLIVREGDPAEEAYIIRRGRCRVFKETDGKTIEIRTMGIGDVFGEAAVFAEMPRTFTVEAIDEVVLAVVTRHHLEESLGLGAWLGLFMHALTERFRLEVQHARHLEEKLKKKST